MLWRFALEDAGVTIRRETNGVYYAKLRGVYLEHLTADSRAEAWNEVVAMFSPWCGGRLENIKTVCDSLAKDA